MPSDPPVLSCNVHMHLFEESPCCPPDDGKCPVHNLPDEIIAYVFQLGVDLQRDRWEEGSSASEDEDEWDDVDDGHSQESDGEGSSDEDSTTMSKICDFEMEDGEKDGQDLLPFQILVSHVCRRWRSVALNTSRFWTTLGFHHQPRLDKAKEYISRSNGLPLTILLDCSTDDESDSDLSDESVQEQVISLEELHEILDLLETAVSQWGTFIFYTSTYDYVHLLMFKLHGMPAAPLLESFQVHIYEDCDDYNVFPGEDKTPYLPFHGHAPKLKEAVFWGIHIDWVGAIPNFLHGLRDLELSYLTRDVRPSYSTFTQIINNSPELRSLTLSLAGPALADGVNFDSDEGWGREPFTISSLEELALQFHDSKYASALVQHLKLPNVTHLHLNFDDEDYSGFVEILAGSAGRQYSLLQQITHLKISGLPCDERSVELLLSQLGALKNLNLKVFASSEEEVIYNKLVDHPKAFCPKLEEFTSTGLDGNDLRKLITARRNAGVPLRRINVATSEEDEMSMDDELWIKENVEEFQFFDASDSEEEYISEGDDVDSVIVELHSF